MKTFSAKPAVISRLLMALSLVLVMSGSVDRRKGSPRPNILFIFADDQRADALGAAGNPYLSTPHIDGLARTGTRFANSYVMGGHHGAICAPSRAMLMSGKSLFHVYDKLDGVYTMPQHFAKYGYATFGTGKWHNGAASFEATFQQGKDVFLGGMSDHEKIPVRDLGADGKLGEPAPKGYSTDIFTSAAIGFIDNHARRNSDKPFFCYVAYTVPHDPRSPRKDYRGLYPDGTIPLPGNYKSLHPFDYGDLRLRDENLAAWPRTPETIQASLSDYYALITHLDARVGDLVESLKRNGLYENTIIVYAADNGLAIGSHGLLGKQNLYEHSMKVPLIISGPGIPENRLSEALVYLYDIFPTLAAVSGLPRPEGVDGKDFSAVIKGTEKGVRESLFTAYRHTVRAVRTKEWKLIRYPERNYTQLFNLDRDPLELYNLAGKEPYSDKEKELFALLKGWQKETGDTLPLTAKKILPLEYKADDFIQKPDQHQPEYTLEKYFK